MKESLFRKKGVEKLGQLQRGGEGRIVLKGY